MTDKLFVNYTGVVAKDSDLCVYVNVILSDKDKKTLYKTESNRCTKPINGILEMYPLTPIHTHLNSYSYTYIFFSISTKGTSPKKLPRSQLSCLT